MHENLNQKISQLLDDELDQYEALSLLQRMQQNPEMQDRLSRYEAISHALKTEVFLAPQSGFAARVSQQIRHEPAYLLPGSPPPRLPQNRGIKRGHKAFAIAASVALVAVIAERNVKVSGEQAKTEVIAKSEQQLPANTPVSAQKIEKYPVNKQINDYLQAHNSSIYINGQANFQPYVKVTHFRQE